MDVSATISFLFVAIGLTIAPGPDILFVVAKSLSKGARAGISVALGLATGTLIHTTLVALGISLLIRNSPPVFACVKWCGVVYLCWLGIKSLMHWKETPFADKEVPEQKAEKNFGEAPLALYRTGVFMAALNPKLILFFLALFPQFVSPEEENATIQTFFLGAIFAVQAAMIFSIVAFFAGKISLALRTRPKIIQGLNVFAALVLFAIAAGVAFF